jgi:hypothetical protein
VLFSRLLKKKITVGKIRGIIFWATLVVTVDAIFLGW